MSDEDDLAVVVQLRPGQDAKDDERPISSAPRESYCGHRRTELRAEERRVYCQECEREVPAFDVLQTLCQDWERFIEHRREAERRCAVARGNLEGLRREERNAKARIRNAKRNADTEAVAILRDLLGANDRGEPRRCRKILFRARNFLAELDSAELGEQ